VPADGALSSRLTNEEHHAVNPQAHAGTIERTYGGTLKHENVIKGATSPGMMGASTTTTMARCRHPAGYDMRRGHDPFARGSDARGHGCGGARARTGGGDVNCSSRSTASLVHRSPITSCTNSERLDPVAARACAACNLAMEDAIAQGDFFFRCPGRNGQRRRVGAAGLWVSAFGRPGFARTRQPSSLAWARPRSARRARHGK
jgi:hypothetical protein